MRKCAVGKVGTNPIYRQLTWGSMYT